MPSSIAWVLLTVASALASDGDAKEKHWAFQPICDPALPAVKNTAWPRNPIDLFILARLESAGLEPAPPASPRDLQRRVYFDLIGLLPPPNAPLRDLESMIDDLLSSPHHGERWGRHWLDVVRYADSNGLDENAAHANAWRYRDFVVRSLNRDLPFDQFLVLQIAGDLLPAEDHAQRHEQCIATAFLSLGPKLLAEPDKVKMEMDIIDEQVDTMGRALLGLTLGCARCHDHKFDPIATEEYYALAGIFKSTKTMDSLVTIAKWHENSLATPDQTRLEEKHAALINAQKQVIAAFAERSNQEVLLTRKLDKLPEKPEEMYSDAAKEELKKLRETLDRLTSSTPTFPTAMGVADGTVTNLPVFLRGDHNVTGEVQPRRFPQVLVAGTAKTLDDKSSGRLELARWIASPENPLTARVIVNRVWRWHFGRGLVATPDNFGQLGERPTHPELLDWLTTSFVNNGWSLKKLHRLILGSATFAMTSEASAETQEKDPTNTLLSRAPLRRIEAEPLRDAILEIAGLLDKQLGGSVWSHANYKLVFDHTSKDTTTYDSNRRAIYLPIIRNNVYGLFELFDFPNPATVGGHRATTITAPQALFLMNSPLVLRSTHAMATSLLAEADWSDTHRVERLYALAYNRSPVEKETRRALAFVKTLSATRKSDDGDPDLQGAWQALCQAIVSANEFVYLR
jgi:hypothetical protein